MKTQIESTKTPSKPARPFSPLISRAMYAMFLLLGAWFAAIGDYDMACSQLGIGLVFDPFDEKQPFGKRPLWQRIWLVIHLVAVMVLLVLMLAGI